MKTYTFTPRLNDNMLIYTPTAEHDMSSEARAVLGEARTYLDQANRPIYFINDMREIKVDLDDVQVGAHAAAREENAAFTHPNLKKVIAVTTDKMLAMAYKGLQSTTFNNIPVEVVSTLDEAFAIVRSGR